MAAGAVVTQDVPAYAIVAGVPARIMGWMSAYGDILQFNEDGFAIDSQGVKYQKLSEQMVILVTIERRDEVSSGSGRLVFSTIASS